MKKVKWLALIGWVVLLVVAIVTMPSMSSLVREHGQIALPADVQSERAAVLLDKLKVDKQPTYQLTAVFHTQEKLSLLQLKAIDKKMAALASKKDTYNITEIVSYNENDTTKKQLLSSDGTTALVHLTVNKTERPIAEIANELRATLKVPGIERYLTGNALIIDDFATSSYEGVKKTEIIALIFIVIVLLLIFKAPLVPLVTLLSVGIAYVIGMSFTAQLVERFDFPFSNFTQIFMVVVLFGVGTDYNILLFKRFQSELQLNPVKKAITETYRHAGKTIFLSGLAVIIGFGVLGFARFEIYQSAMAVAIGVMVLVAVLLTLNPIIMLLVGERLFWPIKKGLKQRESIVWGKMATVAMKRPLLILVLVAVLIIPVIGQYTHTLNYDDLSELNDSYESKQGIQMISKHFPAGYASPTRLAIASNTALDTPEALKAADELAATIAKVDGVATVYAVTRPLGVPLKQLYTKEQQKQLNNGVATAGTALGTIEKGLKATEQRLSETPDIGANVQQLIDGTGEMQTGTHQLTEAINQLGTGFKDGSAGADELAAGLGQLKEKQAQLTEGFTTFNTAYQTFSRNISVFETAFETVQGSLNSEKENYRSIVEQLTLVQQQNPTLIGSAHLEAAIKQANEGVERLTVLEGILTAARPSYQAALANAAASEETISAVTIGLTQMEESIGQLQVGAERLSEGLRRGESGAKVASQGSVEVAQGLDILNGGQSSLKSGLETLAGQIKVLERGMSESADGLSQVNKGLSVAQASLNDMTDSDDGSTFAISNKMIASDGFQKSMARYLSTDKQMMYFNIVLETNPYSKEAMTIVGDIDEQVKSFTKTSQWDNKQVILGGKTVQNTDLQQLAQSDFKRVAIIMLLSMAGVLFFITRSLGQTLAVLSALILSCLSALGFTQWFSHQWLNGADLGWNVPFFSFIMICALGVDYSIFLLMRYREEAADKQALVKAAQAVGGVVLAAGVILAGTFAALYPSGILSLMQVAITVIIGLFALTLLLLPLYFIALLSIAEKIKRRLK